MGPRRLAVLEVALVPDAVARWEAEFHSEGTLGNLGLVPGPLRPLYQAQPAAGVPPYGARADARAYAAHFYDWWEKNRELK